MARYWAAKELTEISISKSGVLEFRAPFAEENFTIKYQRAQGSLSPPEADGNQLRQGKKRSELRPGTWFEQGDERTACFTLRKGESKLTM